jgi:hypothetical protein
MQQQDLGSAKHFRSDYITHQPMWSEIINAISDDSSIGKVTGYKLEDRSSNVLT